jgi:hypothetical protein
MPRRLPDIQRELNKLIERTNTDLRELPPPPSSEPLREILRLITDFSRAVEKQVGGVPGREGLLQRISPSRKYSALPFAQQRLALSQSIGRQRRLGKCQRKQRPKACPTKTGNHTNVYCSWKEKKTMKRSGLMMEKKSSLMMFWRLQSGTLP